MPRPNSGPPIRHYNTHMGRIQRLHSTKSAPANSPEWPGLFGWAWIWSIYSPSTDPSPTPRNPKPAAHTHPPLSIHVPCEGAEAGQHGASQAGQPRHWPTCVFVGVVGKGLVSVDPCLVICGPSRPTWLEPPQRIDPGAGGRRRLPWRRNRRNTRFGGALSREVLMDLIDCFRGAASVFWTPFGARRVVRRTSMRPTPL